MTRFPSYLLDARGLNMRDMSIANVLPRLLGFVGLISGGFISDYIYKLTNNLLFSRKVIIVVGLIIAAICITASALVLNLYGAIALMSVGMFAMYVTTSCYWAIVQDTVKGNNVGAVSGFIHFLANLAGVFAPMLTGFIVQGTGQYYSAFYGWRAGHRLCCAADAGRQKADDCLIILSLARSRRAGPPGLIGSEVLFSIPFLADTFTVFEPNRVSMR